ncbi:hypothetical protein EON63_15135 [archaeon]|nr:MAG: hypothetical protein EON63_15135 [archaeon]
MDIGSRHGYCTVPHTQTHTHTLGMLLRGVLILLVHFRTGMLPPLFVTVLMGFLGMYVCVYACV